MQSKSIKSTYRGLLAGAVLRDLIRRRLAGLRSGLRAGDRRAPRESGA